MRAKTHELEVVIIRLAVDENEIGLDMAVAMVAPFAGQRVIEIPVRERLISGQQIGTTSIKRASSCLLYRPDFSRL